MTKPYSRACRTCGKPREKYTRCLECKRRKNREGYARARDAQRPAICRVCNGAMVLGTPCPECHRQRAHAFHVTCRSVAIARCVTSNAKHIEKRKQYGKVYRATDGRRAQTRKHNLDRRSRDLAAGRFDESDFKAKAAKGCLDCGRNNVPMTVAHLVPLYLGGSNAPDNIDAQCRSCNTKQATKIHVAVYDVWYPFA